jgi:bifunctional non-homologous end joining protein LigD
MLWRVRSRPLPPNGFILPCQPLLVDKPPSGLGWLHEVKHDGYRIIARKDGSRVTLWSRYGTNFTERLPKIAEAICSLAVKSALIDGEAVALRPDGHSDFATLRTKAGSTRACLVAFDLLSLNGKDIRQQPIEDRRGALFSLASGVHGLMFSDALVEHGALVFAKACEMGLEGIISKRVGSRSQAETAGSGSSRRTRRSLGGRDPW